MSNNEDVEKLEASHTGQVFIVLKSRVEMEQEYEKCSFKTLKKFTSPRGDGCKTAPLLWKQSVSSSEG